MRHFLAKSVLSLAAGAATFAIPSVARADHFGVRFETRNERYDARRVWVEPVYEQRTTRVWVEPVYRLESVPVFVNEYFETKCEKVWIEPVYEMRDAVRFEHGRRVVRRERVLVREGFWKEVERKVCVPAHYRHEDRQVLVTPGHFEMRVDRVCVREGRWDTTAQPDRHDRISFGFGFRGRF